ncbi:hypothetical protein B5K06_05605 [Rhizobium grahamii]|uniref:DUF1254 domain-containing protein n=2 Tax=Rhizobium grahamii TaxID=1120045 RepID=A0A370KTP1_9HYPH|nr:hypothetical protein B5K06_05605 [Rhizobium grahamii]
MRLEGNGVRSTAEPLVEVIMAGLVSPNVIAFILVAFLGGNALAEEPGKLAPLPDKLPPSLEARVGNVEFGKGLPTPKGIEQLFEIQDFQRATQLYQWAIPAIGVLGWQRASIANGKTEETDWVIYDDYVPRQGILTPNTQVSYVMAFPDTEKSGPLVLDYGPGKIAGIVMDYWQRPQFDFGLTGPEKGAPGKALIVGPGQKVPDDVAGYHVIQMPTRVAFVGYRVLDRSEKDKLTPLIKLYPYSERNDPPSAKVIAATKDYLQSAPRGLSYWEAVNELIQREPVEDRDRFFYAMLRDLGIEKGKPFKPDERQKKLFEDAALLGEYISKALVYEKRFIPDNRYRPDARWEFALVVTPSQREANYDQLDPRTQWFYEAIAASYAMITKTPGVGSIYLETYYDKDGDWLDGGKSYQLRVPANPPMQQFWAVSVYDIDTRTLLRNEIQKAEISSNSQELQTNADGSVDIYFAPQAPGGKEGNWVQTTPGKFWFPYFRLYAPTQAYFDRGWPLPDIEKGN